MNDIDRVYQLFTEANPAPASTTPTIERPDADVILNEQRNPTMLSKEPRTIETQPSPTRLRRWRGPAIALGTFVGAAVLSIAAWLVVANDGSNVADGNTLPPTTLPPVTTTTLDVVVPSVVSVPNLSGLTLAEARQLLAERGLEVRALPANNDAAIVVTQEPVPGVEVDEGSIVTVDLGIIVAATCNPPDPVAPGPGQMIISVFYECANAGTYPTAGIGVPRIVSEQNEPVDRIETTLRSLLAGPTVDEQVVGFFSFFDEGSAEALNSVTLTDGKLVADFNEAIYINNASTSTGGLFFGAELDRNLFQHPEVNSVEFRINGDCEAWSAFFQSEGCWVTSRADWDRNLAEWDTARNQ